MIINRQDNDEVSEIKLNNVIKKGANCVEHKDSGWRCLVLHPDRIQCKQCSECYTWYR